MAVAGLPFEVQTLAFIGQNVQGQASWPHRPVEIVPAGNERELSKVTAPFGTSHFSNVNYSKQYINTLSDIEDHGRNHKSSSDVTVGVIRLSV
jgi:hypothetical protein